ncbi:MAG: 2-C-methyl-D-erythritol 4-phosphate cytidylyltransferase [Bacteroidales bacterium]|nr:2-C-methyl-D-erythritol 4-phosphate cytidylyltransferase [Bacteroidales bacterium]MBR7167869.1 2-C-methyl-D-erythritol 4-phosphate cytidylyltransferase [Bacteroidales bacterium]
MERYMIIVAGGSGKRMGSDVPKQFLPINGKPILMHTIERIKQYDGNISIIVVLPEGQTSYWQLLCREYEFDVPCTIVFGGKERFYSVKNALTYVPDGCLVGVHDGVRPFVSDETLDRLFEATETNYAVIPAIAPHESVRMDTGDSNSIIDRNIVKLVQTPQIFHSSLLKKAYNTDYKPIFTDDASVVEHVVVNKIKLVEGNRENIKITTSFDLMMAEVIYENYKS